jgi:transglutaminase-like putative cysteine protease
MSDKVSSRAFLPALLVLLVTVLLALLVYLVSRDPVIDQVEPRMVDAGDEVTVRGNHFGTSVSAVLVGGRRVPTGSIILWDDEEIRFRVPVEVGSGLLVVENDRGRSEGELLQIRDRLPQTRSGSAIGAPVLRALSTTELQVGTVVTLLGSGFGSVRRGSRVVFDAQPAPDCACPQEVMYAEWSDQRIRVRVPAAVNPGQIYVETVTGSSNTLPYTVSYPAGRAIRGEATEIAVSYGVSLSDPQFVEGQLASEQGFRDVQIVLPRPATSQFQSDVRYVRDSSTDFVYEEISQSFDTLISRTVLVKRYGVRSEIDAARVPTTYERDTPFFAYYTRRDAGLDLDSASIGELAAVARRAGAPLAIARRAYDLTIDRLTPVLGRVERTATEALELGVGDDLSYARLFVSILRRAGIPARVVGGVFVTENRAAFPHFWGEFFVPAVGWVPADPAFADEAFPSGFSPGLSGRDSESAESVRDFYFGNLDSQRIAFHRGIDSIASAVFEGPHYSPSDPFSLDHGFVRVGAGIRELTVEWFRPRYAGIF